MSLNIVRGRTFGSKRRVIFGPPGVGKSTFACKTVDGRFGNVLVFCFEEGVEEIGVPRILPSKEPRIRTWDGSMSCIREACEGQGDWDTVVIDTADALENLAAKEICQKEKKLSLADFGWGDGFHMVAARWRELLFILEGAKAKNRSVHLVGHVTTATIKDPTLPKDHAKQIASLTKHSWGATHQWADAVLFADYERGMVEGRAIMTGERLLRTVAGTGYDAKHRPNIAPTLPLSWKAYEREFKRYERTHAQIIESIRAKAALAPKGTIDEVAFKAALDLAGEDVEKLVRIELKTEEKLDNKNNGVTPSDPSGPAPANSLASQETK